MEYGGGRIRNFLFILEEMEGRGWKKLEVTLREIRDSLEVGGNADHDRWRLGSG